MEKIEKIIDPNPKPKAEDKPDPVCRDCGCPLTMMHQMSNMRCGQCESKKRDDEKHLAFVDFKIEDSPEKLTVKTWGHVFGVDKIQEPELEKDEDWQKHKEDMAWNQIGKEMAKFLRESESR